VSGVYKAPFQPSDGAPDDTNPGADQPYDPYVDRNPPSEDFDALNASDADLARYNLPPRPDGANAPRALLNWKRAMSGPLSFVQGDRSDVTGPAPFGQHADNTGSDARVQESSRNWSGAYIRSNGGGKFALVEALWSVPKPYPPSPRHGKTQAATAEFGSSVWVGFDGHDAVSMSLPQIGTAQFVTVDDKSGSEGPCRTFAWWQWWVRQANNNAPMLIDRFPVSSGDLIYCRLTVRTLDCVNFFIKNQSSGAAVSFDANAPQPKNPTQGSHKILTEGRTAEWILERPTLLGSKELLPLPDYGITLFYRCNAAVETETGWEELQLEQARLIAIKDWDGPNPGAVVSTPVRQNASSLLLCYDGNLP
jgi:hypothetical protein